MAKIVTITKDDTKESIQQKIKDLANDTELNTVGFDAKKFTGKVKSFGDGLNYQRNLRDEWS